LGELRRQSQEGAARSPHGRLHHGGIGELLKADYGTPAQLPDENEGCLEGFAGRLAGARVVADRNHGLHVADVLMGATVKASHSAARRAKTLCRTASGVVYLPALGNPSASIHTI
jgi:hypothetical protein